MSFRYFCSEALSTKFRIEFPIPSLTTWLGQIEAVVQHRFIQGAAGWDFKDREPIEAA
jgi:hypothetical protein